MTFSISRSSASLASRRSRTFSMMPEKDSPMMTRPMTMTPNHDDDRDDLAEQRVACPGDARAM